MAHVFNIDSSAAVRLTNKLEKLHRSALPVAVRGTLNKAAFTVKQKTMPTVAKQTFVERKANFFKANSKVQMATGFDLNTMRSTVGFIHTNLSYNNYAVEELEEQEYGGKIGHRTFVPTDEARRGGNATPVRPGNRLRNIKGIIDSRKTPGYSRKQKFVRAAIKAGRGGHVIGGIRNRMLYRIERVRRIGRRTIIEQRPLYSYDKGRSVSIQATGFMRKATMQSANNLNKFYAEEAKRVFARHMK
jgi:hypothetical protein